MECHKAHLNDQEGMAPVTGPSGVNETAERHQLALQSLPGNVPGILLERFQPRVHTSFQGGKIRPEQLAYIRHKQ